MSKAQRRDHKPEPEMDPRGIYTCGTCGERLVWVLGYGVPDHWRHWKRYWKA